MITTVLVGAGGFIGGAVFRRMEGHRPYPIFTSRSGKQLDRDARWLGAHLAGVRTVFLCSGQTGGVGKMAHDPLSFVLPNVRIHMNVFELAREFGVQRVVCVGSTTGYAGTGETMREADYMTGDLHPAYFVPGTTHRFIRNLATMFAPLETVFFRPSNVYGPGNDFSAENSHVIEATVRKVAERQDPIVIWGDGSQVRDAVYVDDLADAIALGESCPAGDYNVACGEEMSVLEIVETLVRAEGYSPKIEFDLSKPQAIPARRVDISRARSLGWSPKVSMREGLALTLEWYKKEMMVVGK